MSELGRIKKNILAEMEKLEEELWKVLRAAGENKELSRTEKTSLIIKDGKKLINAINLLFDEISRIELEPGKIMDIQGIGIRTSDEKPTAIRIRGKEIGIRNWNEIPVVIGDWILDQGKKFPEIRNFVSPNKENFAKSAFLKQLNNGWFIEVGDQKEVLIKKTQKLLRISGIPEEIVIESEEGSGISTGLNTDSSKGIDHLMRLYRKASPEAKNKVKEVLGLN